MHFETKKFFIKNDYYLFMKIIFYRDDTNFTKTINRHLIWGGFYYAVLGIPHT
jgi:hypothetical protein